MKGPLVNIDFINTTATGLIGYVGTVLLETDSDITLMSQNSVGEQTVVIINKANIALIEVVMNDN